MKKIIILLALITSFNAAAESQDWSTIRNRAITTNGSGLGVEVEVALSINGKKMIWISTYDDVNAKKVCNKAGLATFTNSNLKINGVNVRAKLSCKNELERWWTIQYAVTKKGQAYILNQFRKSKPVVVNGWYISSKGFNKVWDHVGGDAI